VLTVAWPWLGRRGRIAGVLLAAAVCLARVHVAAHLPLDVVGGVGLGLLVGGLVRLLLGRPG
jgi:membrane-associated phospholipid phosphatase